LINHRVNLKQTRGNRKGGGRKKNQKIGEFSFRGILQPTTAAEPGLEYVCIAAMYVYTADVGGSYTVGLTLSEGSGSSCGRWWCCSCRVFVCVSCSSLIS